MNNPNNGGVDDLTLLEANQNTVRPKAQAQAQAQQTGSNPAVTVRPKAHAQAQAHQTGSHPAVTVRAQVHHDVTYYNFMGLQDPPLLHECFECQKRYPSVRALCGHMRDHPEREWRGLYPPHTPDAIRPPFFNVAEICPLPIAE